METALRSGRNELRAEELVTWKVAGRVNGISYIRHREKGGKKERVRIIATIAKEGRIKIKMKIKERIL